MRKKRTKTGKKVLSDSSQNFFNESIINKDILENLSDGYFLINSDWQYVYVNKKAAELSQRSKEEMIGKYFYDIFPEVLNLPFHKTAQAAIRDNKTKKVEAYFPRFNRWYENIMYPSNGNIAIFARDVTERKTTEYNLTFLADASKILSSSLDYEDTLRNVAAIAVPVIADWCSIEMVDYKGELQQLVVMHKDPEKIKWAKELRKNRPPDMDAPTGLPRVLQTGKSELYPLITDDMLRALAHNKKELALFRSIGFTSAMIVPIFSNKKPIGGISFVTTETRKHFNNNDLSMAEELASRASLAIENARLYKEAQDAIRLRSEFMSIASHELKTPVTSIKAYVQVLQQRFTKRGDEQSAQQLAKMDVQLNKLTNLIGDLLDVTKIESGKLSFHIEEFDFNTLIVEMVEDLQRTTTKHSIIIEGEIQQKVCGDRDRIGQVMTNLITNAIKYSPQTKKILVQISKDGNFVKLCVKDFGVGISKEKQGKVFERFYRVSGPKENTFPGLGLGLYISSEIIKRQGGRIWVESEGSGKGLPAGRQGSKFCFTLPLGRKK